MNVTELIELTNTFATNSIITQKERKEYLQYLNVANADLYAIAARGLNTIVKDVDIFLDEASGSFVLPSDVAADLFIIRHVFLDTKALNSALLSSVKSMLAETYLVKGDAIFCNLKNNTFPTKTDPSDGVTKKYISLYYAPNPLKLVEEISDPSSETNIPIYPAAYHPFLVFGALHYMYLANKIFLEKIMFILKKWEEAKADFAQFKNYGL